MAERISIIILICILAGLVAFGPRLGVSFSHSIARQIPRADVSAVLLENEALRADLSRYADLMKAIPGPTVTGAHTVFVYSTYPSNMKSELLVEGGSAAGIKEKDMAGLPAGKGFVLVGSVETVYADRAIVRTIFDPSFKIPVKVGSSSVDALLEGGSSPRLTLIPKAAAITPGDIVYSASPNFRYGVSIGTVGSFRAVADQFFKAADLEVPYDLNSLSALLIIPGHG